MKKQVIFKPSDIHGVGIFSVEKIKKDDWFKIHPDNTELMRGYNHSCNPNVEFLRIKIGKYFTSKIKAIKNINKNEELVVNYNGINFKCNCEACRKDEEICV